MDRAALTEILLEGGDLRQAIADGRIAVEGDAAAVGRWLSALEDFDPMFNVVEP